MTPRRAGWFTGVGVFTVMAALAIAGSPAHAEDGVGHDGNAFAVAVRGLLTATAAGVLVSCISGATRGRRAVVVAAISTYALSAGWVCWLTINAPPAPEEDLVSYTLGLVAAFVTVGTAGSLAAALLTWWIVRNAVGRDTAERVLALQTTSLHGSRDRWGAAMRAELASIDDPVERGRFARSAGALALRHGTGRWPAILAVLAGLGAGAVVFSASRISFGRPRDRGIIGEPIMVLVILLLVVAVIVGTLIGQSLRAGLETAVLAWLAVYVCTAAVEVPQALAWYHDDGILLLDGEGAAGAGVDALGAALQPLTHFAFVFTSASQLVIAVLAAAFGAAVLHLAERVADGLPGLRARLGRREPVRGQRLPGGPPDR